MKEPFAAPQDAGGGGGGEAPSTARGRPLLVVRAGDLRCGIPVESLREVVLLGRVSRVPEAKAPFCGLMSLRGEVVTVLDLAALQATVSSTAARRGGETTGVTTGSFRPQRLESVVVLRGGRDPLGLQVDGVEEIRELPLAAPAEGPAAPGAWSAGGLWSGVVVDGKGEIGVLSAEAVLDAAEALAGESVEPVALEGPHRG